MTRVRSEHGDVVLGWLTKLAVSLAVIGLLAFDGISLVVSRFSAADHAQTAATAGADSWAQTKDVQKAYDAALSSISGTGDSIAPTDFTVTKEGSVNLTLRREATTLLLHRVSVLQKWTIAMETAHGRPSA